MKIAFYCTLILLPPLSAIGQNGLTLSFPVIYSNVEIRDNWTPPTAVGGYKEYLEGSAVGYGANLNYSFQPRFFIKDKHFFVNIGIGYFKQRFDVKRPFDYNTQVQPIYYTDYYSYHNWQWIVGLMYNYPFKKFILTANVSYTELKSFRQEYTPTSRLPSTYGFFTQTNHQQIDFGKMLNLSLGIKRNLGDRFSVGLNVLIPVYVQWRNDEIFKDDPSTFYSPEFSLGSSICITYNLKEKQ